MKSLLTAIMILVASVFSRAQCDLSAYQPTPGLTATVNRDGLQITWAGESQNELRAQFALVSGAPIIRELAVRKPNASWSVLGRDLSPQFEITSGIRRTSEQQLDPLREMGVPITQEIIDKNRWYAFWDAPLDVPGISPGAARPRNVGLPRKPEEIRHAKSSFTSSSCTLKKNGDRLEITFSGLELGIFSGSLRFTAFRGSNLLRMEAIAKTEDQWVAYKYQAGLAGFTTSLTPRVIWRDTGGHAQQEQFAGAKNDTAAPVRAANRLLIAEGQGASLAVFPPPHKFFFAREVETNLGYVWYRNDGDSRFSIGVRQADREDNPRYVENFALYNAPPGTWQHMAVFFYAAPLAGEQTREHALAYTHGDVFPAVAGYKSFANHFHIDITERLFNSGSLDTPLQDLVAMNALGLNIVGLSDFHELESPLQRDPGPLRFKYEKAYFEGCSRASDKNFLVLPWEEPDVYFGGHFNVMTPKPVYWAKVKQEGRPFRDTDPQYGAVYRIGSAAELQQMIQAENIYWYTSHPRTKGSTGYPDAYAAKAFARSDNYLGISFKPGMGMDLSEDRMCEWRCFGSLDMLNNSIVGSRLQPKYLIADVDTYQKAPEDDLYANFTVNYLKLDKLPPATGDWSPILKSLRAGDFFVTTGEILILNFEWQRNGKNSKFVAELEWTFPLDFLELVWGDGTKVDRQIIPATDLPAFGKKRFELPFDATGKAWIRFSAWDSAGDGAFLQPVWLNQ